MPSQNDTAGHEYFHARGRVGRTDCGVSGCRLRIRYRANDYGLIAPERFHPAHLQQRGDLVACSGEAVAVDHRGEAWDGEGDDYSKDGDRHHQLNQGKSRHPRLYHAAGPF